MPTLFFEHFDDLLATPENAEQLNRAILQLAMQGKLVAQDSRDEPAGELLKRIKVGNSKESKPAVEITEDEQPFELPRGWKWVRLGELCRLENGDRSKANYPNKSILVKEGVPFVNAGHLVDGRIDRNTITFIPKERFDRLRSGKFTNGDILFCLRGSLGKSAIVEGFDAGAIASSLVILKIHPYLSNYYLLNYFDSPLASEMIKKYDNGTAQPNLSAASLAKFLIPLPPLAEQQRIVARVEELFAQTRALAKELAHSQIELDRLNKSALSHLLASETPPSGEFNGHWEFIAEHFDLLFQSPEHIAPLRQSILELAVRGKLTRREAGDESAKELFKRIREERAKRGKGESLPSIKESEKPFELPHTWEWTKLDEILLGIEAGKSFLAEGRPAQSHEFGVLKVSAVTWGEFDPNENKALLPGTRFRNEFSVKANDLLITRANTAELVGAVVLVGKDYPNLLLSDKTLRLNCASEMLKPFLVLALRAPWVREGFADQAIGTSSSMRNISQDKIRSTLIAVPPFAEQERIVKRVEQLLSLCDALEVRLQSAEEERGRLVAAVMAGVGS